MCILALQAAEGASQRSSSIGLAMMRRLALGQIQRVIEQYVSCPKRVPVLPNRPRICISPSVKFLDREDVGAAGGVKVGAF
jgi:hypothetical protein